MTYGAMKSFFEEDSSKEISWQEWVYGEGFFLKHMRGWSEGTYYQVKASNKVVIIREGMVEIVSRHEWEEHVGTFWYKTDMFGNKLEEKTMLTKSDLKTGHILKMRDGKSGVVIKDSVYGEDAVVFSTNNWTVLKDFKEDLTWDRDWLDVVEVYEPNLPCDFLNVKMFFNLMSNASGFKLVWKREAPKPVKDISLTDAEALLKNYIGYDVKIIKE
jgi:hypothetical protein